MENVKVEFDIVREIADVSLDAVIVYSLADKKLIYANTIAFDLVGLRINASRLDIEALLGKVVPQDREYLKNQYAVVRDRYLTGEVEFQITRDNDHPVFLCCNAYLISKKSAIIVFIKDITRLKEHEDYIVEYGARKNTVLESLAHQVSGALNLMQHLSVEAEKYVEITNNKNLKIYLKLLNDNSSHCLDIIYDLLRHEHEVSPEVSVKNSRIDVVDRISIIHDELKQSYQQRKFFFTSSAKSLHINTDEVKLLQVVNNLTSNAIKFSPSTESITIAIANDDEEIIVSVQDRGIGIPPQLQPSIFERQLGAGRTGLKGEKSMGLGLSICKNLIQLMGGKIWFESKEGEGSIFYIALPKIKKQ
jgi:two-component system, OmpR family, sensor histidine kinase VicK